MFTTARAAAGATAAARAAAGPTATLDQCADVAAQASARVAARRRLRSQSKRIFLFAYDLIVLAGGTTPVRQTDAALATLIFCFVTNCVGLASARYDSLDAGIYTDPRRPIAADGGLVSRPRQFNATHHPFASVFMPLAPRSLGFLFARRART